MTRLGATQISQLQSIATKLSELDQKLKASTQRFKLAMQKSGDYIIHGIIAFVLLFTWKFIFFCVYIGRVHVNSIASTCLGKGCALENISANTINSVDVADVYQQAVLVTEKSIPPLRFKRLTVQHHINTTSLSDHGIKNYLHVDEKNNFHGRFTIVGNLIVNGRLNVSGLVDERIISSDALLLRQGNQRFNCRSIYYYALDCWYVICVLNFIGTLKANNTHLKDLQAHLINDQDIRHLYQHAISNTANFTLLQPKFFSSLTVSNLSLSGLINKVNLTQMEETSMKLSGDQVVRGIFSRANSKRHFG